MTVEVEAFAAVLTEALVRHRDVLLHFASRRLGGNRDEAAEVVARAAARAWERRATVRDPSRLRAWLFAVTRSALREHLRSTAVRERVTPCVDVLPEPLAEEGASVCRCAIVLAATLPAAYAEILRLVDVDGERLPEAALRLGIGVNNATVRLSRARQALRKLLRRHCGTTTVAECLDCACLDRGCCS